MAHVIKCPVCGESNLPDQEFCQYCQARMQPLTGKLKGADAPLTPGQIPTKKNTAELEPVLPQWLREARSSARQTSEEEDALAAQQPPETSRPAAVGSDLLAGLQSQTQDNEEEDTPDWLASITGKTPKTKKSQPESSEVRWVELGDTNDFARSEPASDDTPAWLKGMTSSTPQPDEKDELTDWMRGAGDSLKQQQPSQPISFDATPPSAQPANETPDWLKSMAADDGGFNDSGNTGNEPLISSSDAPDWLRAMDAENAVNPSLSNSSSSDVDTPDWLRAMDAENVAQNANSPLSGSSDAEAPDWLRSMDAENAAQNTNTPLSGSSDAEAPDWLRSMDAENAAQNTNTPSSGSSDTDTPDWLRSMDAGDKTSAGFSETGSGKSDDAGDAPDWLKSFATDDSSSELDWMKGIQSGESSQPVEEDSAPAWLSSTPTPAPEPQQPFAAPKKDDSESDIPSWLKAAAPQSSIFDEPIAQQEAPTPASSFSDTPDWLNAFKSIDTPESQAAPVFSADSSVDSAPSAFSDSDQPRANADALFTEMPDWLSTAADSPSPESIPAPITNVDAIAPGDLPSWVQAMRPMDSGVSQVPSTSLSGDTTIESRGALAGLQGVLPAVLGFSPTSKPKAYSIKLHASEEQQAHAALLEQILSAETSPVPIGSFFVLGPSRLLRGLLTLLFFVGLTTVLFMRTTIFSMPAASLLPAEVADALNVIRSVPEGAPVLVAFDYEPARVGEMEAAAAPMFDQMMLLRHPRLTFISTNETGAIMAERFIAGPLAGYNLQSGVQYLNLGYLPNGQIGIRAFVQDPKATAPNAFIQSSSLPDFKFTPTDAWALPPLQGIDSLSQFAALIVVTDNADSARAWIEQTTSAPGVIPYIPFVTISSAQAAPMIQPYYASKQINGLVSGLYGSALVEQNNAGRPGTARTYWDAYSIGMLIAVVLILGGGLLNLALGLRDRSAARGEK